MKTFYIVASVILGAIIFIGCHYSGSATTTLNNLATQATVNPEENDRLYRTVSMVSWDVKKNVRVEARLEVLNQDCQSKPCQVPYSRLIVKNLATNRIIYQRDDSDEPVCLYLRGSDGLIINWRGGSADRIEILLVAENEAHRVLYESYRLDAALITFTKDEEISVLITTAEGGGMPLYTTRYVWEGDRYKPVSRISFEHFSGDLTKLFKSR